MPLRLDVKKKLSAHSDRVKSVDLHPTEPWTLASLYSGHVFVWDHNTQTLVKQIEVCNNLPVRCAKFCARKNWIITASDEMKVDVFNYNSLEKIKSIEAHTDYIRWIAVHPTQPYLLSASDDFSIKLWDWDKKWECVSTYEGHRHYVMQVQWNPKDANIFASASLDRAIKFWGTAGATNEHFSLTGHQRGVNCLDFNTSGDKPYLVSGADDMQVRVWDYQTRQCVQILEGHDNNVSTVLFHPHLPIILTGSEDNSVRVWHSSTYRMELTMDHKLERCWSISAVKGTNDVAVGYDGGSVVLKLGSEEPVVSMTTAGKIVWAKGTDIQTANLKLTEGQEKDGERVSLSVKDMGQAEVYPQSVHHHPNGRLFACCGDGEYVIYTAQVLRNKAFGSAQEFVWSFDGGYATIDAIGKITVFADFAEVFSFKPPFVAEKIFGGRLLGVRGEDCIVFYDWTQFRIIRRIDIGPKTVHWNEAGTLVALVCDDSFFVLSYDKDAVAAVDPAATDMEDGIEEAFDLQNEITEKVMSALFVGDTLVYVTSVQRLLYLVGGQVETIAHLDKNFFVFGYLPDFGRLYLIDREFNIITYMLPSEMIQYQTAIIAQDYELAEELLQKVDVQYHTRIARFLDHQGQTEMALRITKDKDHQLELALQMGKLELAKDIIYAGSKQDDEGASGGAQWSASAVKGKWKTLGDTALEQGDFDLASTCFEEAADLAALFLVHTACGDAATLEKTADTARQQGKGNIAVLAYLLLGKVKTCLEVFIECERLPEAAFFARTYCPSELPRVVALWKEDVKQVNTKIADSIANPATHGDMFPEYKLAIRAEAIMERKTLSSVSTKNYSKVKEYTDGRSVLADIEEMGDEEFEKAWGSGIGFPGAKTSATTTSTPFSPPPRTSSKKEEAPVVRQPSVKQAEVAEEPPAARPPSVKQEEPAVKARSEASILLGTSTTTTTSKPESTPAPSAKADPFGVSTTPKPAADPFGVTTSSTTPTAKADPFGRVSAKPAAAKANPFAPAAANPFAPAPKSAGATASVTIPAGTKLVDDAFDDGDEV